MTTHDFDAFADGNLDPQPDDGQQAAVNTLKDICRLADADLPSAAALLRCRRIASATLARLGVPPAVEDLGGPSGRWCEDDPLAGDDGLVDIGPELQAEPPF